MALTEKQKQVLRRLNGTRQRWALDKPTPAIKKTRDYLSVVKSDYVPPRLRGQSGTRLSASKRAMVQTRLGLRRAFFESFGTGGEEGL
jgi:hypothetical protein